MHGFIVSHKLVSEVFYFHLKDLFFGVFSSNLIHKTKKKERK